MAVNTVRALGSPQLLIKTTGTKLRRKTIIVGGVEVRQEKLDKSK